MKTGITPRIGRFSLYNVKISLLLWPLVGLVLALAGAPSSARAANLLVNPSFEANSGHVIAAGWTRFAPTNAQPFGDYWVEKNVPAHTGTFFWKQWGPSYVAGQTNVAGISQTFSSAPTSVYQASGWMYTLGTDQLAPDCKTWLEVRFLGASSNLLALFKSDDFQASAGTDAWLLYTVNRACDISSPLPPGDFNYPTYAVTGTVSQLTAPPGTTAVQFRYAYSEAGTEGGSAYFDDALLDQVSGPLPPAISNISPLNMIFINPADGISFNVNSPSGFTINNSAIGLVVNGVNVSGSLQISGSSSNKTATYFGLQSNFTYNASITVTDSFGFSASATTYFETTWVGIPPVSYLWEVEDFDFTNGLYFNNPTLCNTPGNPNCYYGTVGVEGVDEHAIGSGGNHLYRPDDAIQISTAGDYLRKPLVAAGRLDYRIDPLIGGEWLNYTRDWGNTTNWVIARVATGEGLAGSLDLSLVTPSATNDLGTFTVSSGRGWTTYDNVFLKDTNGNIAIVTLSGKQTLRLTSGGNLLPNFFMLTPAAVDLPVMSGLYPTGNHPFEPTNTLSFTVTTVGATFPANGIQLLLDGIDVSAGLQINGPASAKNVVYPSLLPNAVHTAIINVTNSLGHGLSVTNNFDTFSQDNYMVEAEDFDYGGGQYIADWLPGSYTSLGATTNIDFQHITESGEQFAYRTDGIPEEKAQDFIRDVFITWGATDYHLAWFGAGDWANYTRVYPTNTFYAYVRSGGFGPYTMSLDQVVSGATTVNQVTQPLGVWNGVGKDNQTHAWVLLTDNNSSAPRAIKLGGLATLRLSTSTGNCHPSYFMFVPVGGITVSATRSGGNAVISFPTQAGVVYRVFSSTSAAGGSWSLLTSVLGNGGVQSVSDPVGVGQKYYRVSAP